MRDSVSSIAKIKRYAKAIIKNILPNLRKYNIRPRKIAPIEKINLQICSAKGASIKSCREIM
jgi:hypothetical protein